MKRITVVAVAACVLILLIGIGIIQEWRGEGLTPTSLYGSMRATSVVRDIENEHFEAAAECIGFWKGGTPDEWTAAMHAVFDYTLDITDFSAGLMTADDGFVSGETTMQVIERESGETFEFVFRMTLQQNGVVFGDGRVTAGDPTHGRELCDKIENALCTWYAG